MRRALALMMALCLAAVPLSGASSTPRAPVAAEQEQPPFEPYTAEQLDNLLSPIALYPDPLLAQVLVAATFVDQIDVAARWVRTFGQTGIDSEPWDVSVRAVAHYPTVLAMMADDLDWTTAVGQAYVYQSTDVMASIQRLRTMARAQGNLVTTQQQEVIVAPGYIQIWPAEPRYIYVPVYDPGIIFFRPIYRPGITTVWISFGRGWAIGVWLNLDFNWPYRRIYYTGWVGGGWIARCRPYIRTNRIYVNPRYRSIAVNRMVIRRRVNFRDFNRYRSIHRHVNFDNRMRAPTGARRTPVVGNTNKIIKRNINTYDPNLNRFRGRAPTPAPAVRREPTRHARPTRQPTRPETRAPARPAQKAPTARPPVRPAPAQRAPSAPAARRPATRTPPRTFGSGNTVFSPRAASQRGQASRARQKAKPQASRPKSKKPGRRQP